jgi:hypothetical protein
MCIFFKKRVFFLKIVCFLKKNACFPKNRAIFLLSSGRGLTPQINHTFIYNTTTNWRRADVCNKNVRKRCCHLSFHGITTKLQRLISLLGIKLSEFNDTKKSYFVCMIFIEFFIFLKYISHKMSFGENVSLQQQQNWFYIQNGGLSSFEYFAAKF